jgi:HAD domain in Swiss Army Knife RNA repair proteins
LAAGTVFDGYTPDLPKQTRAKEIAAWLKEHSEFARYAVLDDAHNSSSPAVPNLLTIRVDQQDLQSCHPALRKHVKTFQRRYSVYLA